MDKKIYYVILHYNNNQDTINCVNSVICSHKVYPKIIIIDNNSTISNAEVAKLKDKNINVDFIRIKRNLGYAKANNIGFKIAKRSGAEIIIILNNDTIINESFASKLEDNNTYDAAVVGPRILTINRNQNPLRCEPLSVRQVKSNICNIRKSLIFTYIPKKIQLLLKKMIRSSFYNNELNCSKKYDIVLHGACLIFTKKFIEVFDYPFDSRTFLYVEEDILYYRCKQKGLCMQYDDSISIIHLEDGSTNVSIDSSKKKRFILKNQLKSYKILYRVVKKNLDASAN